jgi:hypothetical protein
MKLSLQQVKALTFGVFDTAMECHASPAKFRRRKILQ